MPRPCNALVVMLLAAIGGCGPPATEGGFDSANSAARMYAIEEAARTGDRTAVRDIVQLLDSDDPGVRWMAIGALQRLTGETFGYHHYDSPAQRRDENDRWVQALDSGEITIQPMNIDADNTAATRPQPAPADHTPHG